MTWDELRAECTACTRCPLHETRNNCVFGAGSEKARLLFVGEAPGEREDATGMPFVGAAGQLLDRYLEAVGIERSDVYITNVLKCRPPKNRDPLPAEEDACLPFLREQVRLLRPKIIVCLGRISAMRLIKPDFKITREHGVWFERAGVRMCAVYHPSLLLRDPRKREDMYTDMKAVKAELDALAE
jgi:DNA polymerase